MAANESLRGLSGKLGDLKRRLWFLLLALVVYRIGAHVGTRLLNAHALQLATALPDVDYACEIGEFARQEHIFAAPPRDPRRCRARAPDCAEPVT